MKRYLYFPLIILSVLIALTGCSKDEDQRVKGLTPLASTESWFESAKSSQSQGYDPQVMVVIFSLDNLPVDCTVEDVSAAFVGEQCRYAVSTPTIEDKMYGLVVMYRLDAEGNAPLSFNIRYYSQKEKGYFTSKPITFVSNQTLGTLSTPISLSWVME